MKTMKIGFNEKLENQLDFIIEIDKVKNIIKEIKII